MDDRLEILVNSIGGAFSDSLKHVVSKIGEDYDGQAVKTDGMDKSGLLKRLKQILKDSAESSRLEGLLQSTKAIGCKELKVRGLSS